MSHIVPKPGEFRLEGATFHCDCGARHSRGPVNGDRSYRCIKCGNTHTFDPPTRARPMTYEERMTALAESFPCLRNAPGVRPWRPNRLEDWCNVASSGEKHAARFVLHVWNCTHEWECGPFEVVKAMCVWSDDNRAAFVAWAENPWTA